MAAEVSTDHNLHLAAPEYGRSAAYYGTVVSDQGYFLKKNGITALLQALESDPACLGTENRSVEGN